MEQRETLKAESPTAKLLVADVHRSSDNFTMKRYRFEKVVPKSDNRNELEECSASMGNKHRGGAGCPPLTQLPRWRREEAINQLESANDRNDKDEPINLLEPRSEGEDDDDPFGNAEDMERIEVSDDEYSWSIQSMTNFSTRVHGPSEISLSELLNSHSDDEDPDLQPNKTVMNGLSKFGIGASALPNSAVIGAKPPASIFLLASATCNH